MPSIIFAVLKFIRNNIPNAITSANLFCGVAAIYFASISAIHVAAILVIAGAVFDFFDGMSARLLKSDSKIGKDLDSLADVVSFGVAPVFIYINLCKVVWVKSGTVINPEALFSDLTILEHFWWVFAALMLIAVFSAIRLAIFNNDTRQTTSFIGLPTPANGLLIISFALIWNFQNASFPNWLVEPWFVVLFSIVSCFMLVMPLPLFALKFKQWGFKGNEVRYLFLLTSAILLVVLQFVAIPLIIILYILLSLILNFAKK